MELHSLFLIAANVAFLALVAGLEYAYRRHSA